MRSRKGASGRQIAHGNIIREGSGGADIPDRDSLQADACGPGYSYEMNQRLLFESKDHMRARGIRSPDEWDAVALTFAEPVRDPPSRRIEAERPRPMPLNNDPGLEWLAW